MKDKLPSSEIRIGPAGWSYADWWGIVYPTPKPRGFHEPEYLAQFFDTIEINTSFYGPLRPDMAKSWIRHVAHNSQFRFTAKLWKGFTHERNATHQDEKLFKEGLAPLVEAGRLGALLLQFPWSFKNTKENHEYLSGLFMQFIEYPLALEVRHSSWNQPDVFKWLVELGIGFCNIDQPLFSKSMRPNERATAPVGYIRLHGRNYKHWFAELARTHERYDYFYTVEELEPWVERIKIVAEQTEVTYVIANNHFQGKAVANALQLISLITNHRVRVPETLKSSYRELENIALPETRSAAPKQADLHFDALPKNS